MGWKLDTTDARGTIKVDNKEVPGTKFDSHCPSVSWAVFNRQTLVLEESDHLPAGAAGLKAVADLAQRYVRDPSYLMVVNLSALPGLPADARRLFTTLGVKLVEPYPATARPVSIVGVPGSRPGSAFISDHFRNRPVLPLDQASMSGYLRLNPLPSSLFGGHFEFVLADQLEFDTDIDPDPGRITIKIGGRTYSRDVPTDGRSGFWIAIFDSRRSSSTPSATSGSRTTRTGHRTSRTGSGSSTATSSGAGSTRTATASGSSCSSRSAGRGVPADTGCSRATRSSGSGRTRSSGCR